MNIGHEAEKLLTSEHLRSNIVKKPKEKHSSRSKKTSGRENSRSSSSTRLSPSLSSEKKFCSRSRKSRTQSLSPLSGCSVGKEFVASSKSIRCRSPSKRVSTRKTRKSRSRSSDIKQCCCSPHQSRRDYSRCSKSHHYSNSETTKSRKSESPKYRSRSSRSDLRDHSEKSPSSSSRSSRRSRDTRYRIFPKPENSSRFGILE